MSTVISMALRPEERKNAVHAQLRESVRLLMQLESASGMSDEVFEFELRMQILWLTNAANQWHEAARERQQILQARAIYLKREGPGQ